MNTVTVYRLRLTIKNVSTNEFLYCNDSYTRELNKFPQYLHSKIEFDLPTRPGGGFLEIDNPEIKPPFKGVFPAKLKVFNREKQKAVRQEMYDKILNVLAEYNAYIQLDARERGDDYNLLNRLAFSDNQCFFNTDEIDVEIEYVISCAEIEEKKWV